MTALATGRITQEKGPTYGFRTTAYPVAANAIGYAGGLACLDASGFLVPAADTVGFSDCVGVIQSDFDNTGGANSAFMVDVKTGIHELENSGLAQIDVDGNCAIVDDQTVGLGSASTNKIRAGKLVKYVSASSVWVDVGNPAPARTFVSAEVTGNGGAQNTAHGLGSIPWRVFATVSELPDAAAETGFDVAPGAHTATNAVFTVTNTVKYYVVAVHG